MEHKAHFVLIGTFVLAAFVAALVFVAWLSNTQFDQSFDEYEVVFNGPVRGLSQGSEVHYNGLKVGEVIGLRWDDNDTNTVIADVRVIASTPVHIDSAAKLEPQGLTGLNYIQITSGESNALFEGRPPWRISGEMSQIDTFISDGGSLLEASQRAIDRVNRTLSPEAVNDFHGILENINIITGNLRDTDVDDDLFNEVLMSFKTAADNVSNAAIAVDEAADEFNTLLVEDMRGLGERVDVTLSNVDTTLASFTEFANGGTKLTEDSRDAINRLSNSGLTDLEETADSLRRLVQSLNEMIEGLERNPTSFIAGQERETMDLPQ